MDSALENLLNAGASLNPQPESEPGKRLTTGEILFAADQLRHSLALSTEKFNKLYTVVSQKDSTPLLKDLLDDLAKAQKYATKLLGADR